MVIYLYSEDGTFTGEMEWLEGLSLPDMAATIAPPQTNGYESAIFDNGGWYVIADYRGQTVYDKQGVSTVILSLGQLPEGLTPLAPALLPIPLDQAIQEKLDELGIQYAIQNAANIPYLGTYFQADVGSTLLMSQVLTTLTASGGINGITWFDINNNPVSMSYSEFANLCASLLIRGQILFSTAQAKKATVRAATTVAAVQTISF